MQGVYRQRSYDNLQNGKSPFHRNSVKSLHLPTSSSYSMSNYNSSANNSALGKRLSFNSSNHHQQNHAAIPSHFKFVSPQQTSSAENFDSNSLPRYPYHRNRAVRSVHHGYDGACVVEYYQYGHIRHPLTPPPPPPKMASSPDIDEHLLLPTPTSSTSSGDHYSSNSEFDPMIASSSKRVDHMIHYRACKKQIQHATQQFLQPNFHHQMYIDNYFNHLTQHGSPYKRHTNNLPPPPTPQDPHADSSHIINMQHHVYHNPNKRHSNIYEYHFSNFDLNAIHEDGRHDS